ncbi:hypothetical protein F2Q69_00001376 [Brassica cretica]|uniref:Uncharacterized protein n=1 Tax=Brassica cretica TaxID=69181 RepID=A0A8S9NW32_BRACR|nr:hypothetical protein F2Q69_00001376 [Brassica cretica]
MIAESKEESLVLDSREVEGDDNNVEDESEEFRLRSFKVSGDGGGGGGGGGDEVDAAAPAAVAVANEVEYEYELEYEPMLRQEMIFKNSAHLVKVVLCSSLFTREQASRDHENYFNIRMLLIWLMVHKSCISLEQVVENTTLIDPIYRLYIMVKPCPRELKCDVEVSSYAIRDAEEYINFCDRPTLTS